MTYLIGAGLENLEASFCRDATGLQAECDQSFVFGEPRAERQCPARLSVVALEIEVGKAAAARRLGKQAAEGGETRAVDAIVRKV